MDWWRHFASSFVLVAVQDIAIKEALDHLVQELNHPTIPVLKDLSSRPGQRWKSFVSDVPRSLQESGTLGFLYDASSGLALKHASTLPLESHFTRLPFVAVFRFYEKFDVIFVNLHLEAHSSEEDETASFSALAQAIQETFLDDEFAEQKAVVLLGDFNHSATSPVFLPLLHHDYSPVLQENTNESPSSICMDNIWLSASARAVSGQAGVVRDHLSSVWIPSGWSWGGSVSEHCPVWADLKLSWAVRRFLFLVLLRAHEQREKTGREAEQRGLIHG